MSTATMTKAAAIAMARRVLSYGHFTHPDGAMARCPVCAERGRRYDVVLYAEAGGRLAHGDMVRQLTRAILDCSADRDEHDR